MSTPSGGHEGVRKSEGKRARVVITMYVEMSDTARLAEPAWRRHVLSALRHRIESQNLSPTKLIAWLRRSKAFTVIEEKIEVST